MCFWYQNGLFSFGDHEYYFNGVEEICGLQLKADGSFSTRFILYYYHGQGDHSKMYHLNMPSSSENHNNADPHHSKR